MSVQETSLTGTESYAEMKVEKNKWDSLDDDWIDDSYLPRDHENGRLITLEPQRIRTFKIVLKPSKLTQVEVVA
jgi:hypothetical protein